MPKGDYLRDIDVGAREDVGAAFTGRYPHPMEFAPQSPNVQNMEQNPLDLMWPWLDMEKTDRKKLNELPQSTTGESLVNAYKHQGLPRLEVAPLPSVMGRQLGSENIHKPTKEEMERYRKSHENDAGS